MANTRNDPDTSAEAVGPDWEGFCRAIVEHEWVTRDIEGSDLFDLAISYGLIREIPGGYDPEHHFDADGICPERGDPWYEYSFRGEGGPGLYSVFALAAERDTLQAKVDEALELLNFAVEMTGEPQCWHDHHGYCQAHNLEPKGECWVEKSHALIAKLKG